MDPGMGWDFGKYPELTRDHRTAQEFLARNPNFQKTNNDISSFDEISDKYVVLPSSCPVQIIGMHSGLIFCGNIPDVERNFVIIF